MMKYHSSSAILLPKRISMNFARPIFTIVLLFASTLASLATTITSFLPASGQVGTLLTVKGTGFTVNSTLSIGGKPAIIISFTATQIVGMVMPGAITGNVKVNTTNAATTFTVTETPYPIAQQGHKMADAQPARRRIPDLFLYHAKAVALNADGNTAIVAGQDYSGAGAAIFSRQHGRWQKVSPFIISESWAINISVAISADGSTAVIGGTALGPVPVLVVRKVNGSWSQPLVENLVKTTYDPDAFPQEGHTLTTGSVVSVTADGNTIVAGSGVRPSSYATHQGLRGDGVSIFKRNSDGWQQAATPPQQSRQYLGTPKSEGRGFPDIGATISADGKTIALIATSHLVRTGLYHGSGYITKPYTIIFGRVTKTSNIWVPQQLLAACSRVQLSADGNTLLATDDAVNYIGDSAPGTGTTHIYTRNGTTWSLAQDIHEDGEAVLSADGSTLLIANNATVYTRIGGSYVKKAELKPGYYATSAALSTDGSMALVGNPYDNGSSSSNSFTGATFAFGSGQSAPGQQATNITYNSLGGITGTTMGLSWANGSGTGRAVFMKETTALDEPAPDDRYFKPEAQFNAGDQVANSGWYCVYNGTGANVDVQGLIPNASYRIAVLEYGGTLENPLYLPLAPLLGIATPLIGPPLTQASNLVLSNRKVNYYEPDKRSSATLSWTNGSGVGRAVFSKRTYDEQPTPADLLSAGNIPGVDYNGWTCIYNGTGSTVNLTDLEPERGFTVAVLEYSDRPVNPKYLFPAAIKSFVSAASYHPASAFGTRSESDRQATDITFEWSGAGTSYADEPSFGSAVFATENDLINPEPFPADVYYSPNSKFGLGSQIGTSGWYCVYNGPTSKYKTYNVKVTGLTTGAYYRMAIVSYSGPANAPVYIREPAYDPFTASWVSYARINTRLVAPTGYATGLAFSNTAATSTTLSWVNSNGMARAVFLKLGTSGALDVQQESFYDTYNPSSTFGEGSMAGTNGWYCVYNGTGNSVDLVGLNPSSTYRAIVLEYNQYSTNGYTHGAFYNLSRYNGANVTTLTPPNTPAAPPTGYATAYVFSNTAATTTTLSWVSSNGTARAVFLRKGTGGALTVIQGQTYLANNTFGLGDMAGTNGWYCVYNGRGSSVNISSLTASSTYRAIVIEYNGVAGSEGYNLSRYNGANVTTTVAPALVLTSNPKRLLVEQDALEDNTTPDLTIHQGLSPNGDGDNDVFTIDGIGAYPQNTVKIMNSNGDVIYTATGYDNYLKAFDGHSAKGDLQKAGTYFYSLEYKKGGDTIRKTGYLIIKY